MQVRYMLVVGLLALVPLSAMPAPPENLAATFSTLENTFARGYQEKNMASLDALLAPEYTLTVSARPGVPVTRAQWLALLPNYNVHSFDIHDVQAQCLRNTKAGQCELAAVSSINKQDADVGGQDRSGEFFIVDIWARRSDKWMVVSRYAGRTEAAVPKLMQHQ